MNEWKVSAILTGVATAFLTLYIGKVSDDAYESGRAAGKLECNLETLETLLKQNEEEEEEAK